MRSCYPKGGGLFVLAASLLACTCLAARGESPAYRGRDLGQWTGALESSDVRQRWYAALALAQIGPGAGLAAGPLMTLLAERSQYEYVRAGAAFALGRIQADADRVVPLLAETLGSELASVRRHSARALGLFGQQAESAVPQMLSQLRRDDPVFRIELAEALWRVARHEKAIPFLISQVRDSAGSGSFEAVEALGRLAPDSPREVVPALIEALGSDNADVARSAARALGRAGTDVSGQLASAAAVSPMPVRCRIVESYGWMGPAGASALIGALKDPAPEVRRAAVRALGRLGPEVAAVEPVLLRTVNDTDPLVRATAGKALERIGGSPPHD